MTDTITALIRVCLAQPDDRDARLVLADCIQDNDMLEWAGLIRVQVELKAIEKPVFRRLTGEDGGGPIPDPLVVRHAALRECEAQLLRNESKLRFGVLAERTTITSKDGERFPYAHRVGWYRGLPRIECELAECGAEVDEPCPECHGGEIRPTRSDNYAPCSECHGANVIRIWQPSPFVTTAMRECGATVGVVNDKWPWSEINGHFSWRRDSATMRSHYPDRISSMIDAINAATFGAAWPKPTKVKS